MKEGPDIAVLGSLIGDPARANILTALMSGKALTATELSAEANVTLQTTSSHLAKLQAGQLITQNKQGRHRYFTLADDTVGALLEAMMGVAVEKGFTRTRTGPKDPALRNARVCYNHLAGEMAVRLYDSLIERSLILSADEDIELTDRGDALMTDIGIDLPALRKLRRPLCRSCLDWSMRRSHLSGALGSALLNRFYELDWAKREPNSRIITFSAAGRSGFEKLLAA